MPEQPLYWLWEKIIGSSLRAAVKEDRLRTNARRAKTRGTGIVLNLQAGSHKQTASQLHSMSESVEPKIDRAGGRLFRRAGRR